MEGAQRTTSYRVVDRVAAQGPSALSRSTRKPSRQEMLIRPIRLIQVRDAVKVLAGGVENGSQLENGAALHVSW